MRDYDRDLDGRDAQLLAGLRMIGSLGHSCGLVDPWSGYSPMTAILDRLAEVSPWITETPEYKRARERTTADPEPPARAAPR